MNQVRKSLDFRHAGEQSRRRIWYSERRIHETKSSKKGGGYPAVYRKEDIGFLVQVCKTMRRRLHQYTNCHKEPNHRCILNAANATHERVKTQEYQV